MKQRSGVQTLVSLVSVRIIIKLDEPIRKNDAGASLTYITDPWGTRIELVQRPTS